MGRERRRRWHGLCSMWRLRRHDSTFRPRRARSISFGFRLTVIWGIARRQTAGVGMVTLWLKNIDARMEWLLLLSYSKTAILCIMSDDP